MRARLGGTGALPPGGAGAASPGIFQANGNAGPRGAAGGRAIFAGADSLRPLTLAARAYSLTGKV